MGGKEVGRYVQRADGKGSLRDIQVLINKYPALLTGRIQEFVGQSLEIEWLSPEQADGFAEYRDEEFLKNLGCHSLQVPLERFWPARGPQWDGLGRSEKSVFLIEAKANIPELLSPPMKAKDDRSVRLIRKSLAETKLFVRSKSTADWSKTFYQYTNRLAHLYYLTHLNGKSAYLICLYFTGDASVNGHPTTRDEWRGAVRLMKEYLGIGNRNRLSPFIIDIYIDLSEIGC
jgi:hypothetical protein